MINPINPETQLPDSGQNKVDSDLPNKVNKIKTEIIDDIKKGVFSSESSIETKVPEIIKEEKNNLEKEDSNYIDALNTSIINSSIVEEKVVEKTIDNRGNKIPLYGDLSRHGYWYLYALIGSTKQRTSVIIDTGSPITAFGCTGCKTCGPHSDRLFDISASSTAVRSSCKSDVDYGPRISCINGISSYDVRYTEGSSISGFMFTDSFELNDNKEVRNVNSNVISIIAGNMIRGVSDTIDITRVNDIGHPELGGDTESKEKRNRIDMGCQIQETGMFRIQQVNGILGLNIRSPASSVLGGSSGSFGICLSVSGGELYPDFKLESHMIEGIKWLTLLERDFYSLDLLDISNSSTDDVYQEGLSNVMVDTGTTYCGLHETTYSQITQELHDECLGIKGCSVVQLSGPLSSRMCFVSNNSNSHETIQKFPDLNFRFSGTDGIPVVIPWKPNEYLEDVNDKTGASCFCFAARVTADNRTFLGASFLINRLVIFDTKDMKLGFHSTTCSITEDPYSLGSLVLGSTSPDIGNTEKMERISRSINDHYILVVMCLVGSAVMLFTVVSFLRRVKETGDYQDYADIQSENTEYSGDE